MDCSHANQRQDCSHTNQRQACSRCSQMIPPPTPVTDYSCNRPPTTIPTSPQIQPPRIPTSPQIQPPRMEGTMSMHHRHYCPNTSIGGMEGYPIGMGYVPWQQWQQTYPLDQALRRGTIFPELDLPFVMGRCR